MGRLTAGHLPGRRGDGMQKPNPGHRIIGSQICTSGRRRTPRRPRLTSYKKCRHTSMIASIENLRYTCPPVSVASTPTETDSSHRLFNLFSTFRHDLAHAGHHRAQAGPHRRGTPSATTAWFAGSPGRPQGVLPGATPIAIRITGDTTSCRRSLAGMVFRYNLEPSTAGRVTATLREVRSQTPPGVPGSSEDGDGFGSALASAGRGGVLAEAGC